jgi:hypothetical protein
MVRGRPGITRKSTAYGKAPDKTPSGPQLDILTAQKVFGWKNIHQHDGTLIGKKQDKARPLAEPNI